MVDKKTHQVICTDFSNGKKHDFRLFKESKILIHPKVKAITDTGYQGILLVNEELVDEDQNQQVLGVSKPRSTAYIST